MVFFTLGHYVLGWVPVSDDRREFLEQAHFYVVTSAWIWFSLTLLAEVVKPRSLRQYVSIGRPEVYSLRRLRS
jgi:hypothetical protein